MLGFTRLVTSDFKTSSREMQINRMLRLEATANHYAIVAQHQQFTDRFITRIIQRRYRHCLAVVMRAAHLSRNLNLIARDGFSNRSS